MAEECERHSRAAGLWACGLHRVVYAQATCTSLGQQSYKGAFKNCRLCPMLTQPSRKLRGLAHHPVSTYPDGEEEGPGGEDASSQKQQHRLGSGAVPENNPLAY